MIQHSFICYCGFETPPTDDIPFKPMLEVLKEHQGICEFKPDWSDETVAQLLAGRKIVPVSKLIRNGKKTVDCYSNNLLRLMEEEE